MRNWLPGIVASLVSGLIGTLVGGAIAWKAAGLPYELEHPGEATIESHEDRTSVPERAMRIAGSAELPEIKEVQLWLVVRVDVNEQGTYYPQGYAIPDEEGQWSCAITLGSTDVRDDGKYKIMAVFADPSAARQLREYVANELGKDSGGMDDYPSSGIDVKDSLHLERDTKARSSAAVVDSDQEAARVGRCGS